jgi:hypothetical protein
MIVHDRCWGIIGETLVVKRRVQRRIGSLIKSQLVFEFKHSLSKTKAVKPASNGQGLRPHLSNATRACRALLLIAFVLCGCVPNWPRANWKGYVSETETLHFVAGASCNVDLPFNPIQTDFFEPLSVRPVPGEPWTFVFTYNTINERKTERLDVVQWWTARKTFTAPSKPYDQYRRCAVLVDVPQSKNGRRPYYLEDERAKTAEYQRILAVNGWIVGLLCAVAVILTVPAAIGADESCVVGPLTIGAASAVVLIGPILAGYVCLRLPWHEFTTAQAYFQFYNDLPRRDGMLLPLSSSEFYFLLSGPPHPSETQFDFQTYVWTTVILASAWFVGIIAFVVRGLYTIFVPLPLAVAYRRAAAKGRELTADEALTATQNGLSGKRPWQLRIMRRKAQAFARHMGSVAIGGIHDVRR